MTLDELRAEARPRADEQPAGERYFRHPGDVVRLVVWVLTAIVLTLFVEIATATGVRVAIRISRQIRKMLKLTTAPINRLPSRDDATGRTLARPNPFSVL